MREEEMNEQRKKSEERIMDGMGRKDTKRRLKK